MKFRAVFLQERMKVVVELGSELTLRRSKVEILTGIIVSNLLEVGGKMFGMNPSVVKSGRDSRNE